MYRLSDKVRTTHHSNRAIVLHITHGWMFSLNPVGSRIVEMLKNGSSERQVVEVLAAEYNVARELVASDIDEFFSALKKHGVLEE